MSMYIRGASRSGHPIAQFVSLLAVLAFATVAVLVGAVIFSFLFGVAALAGIALYARLWWLRRKGERAKASRGETRGRIIEAQYEVIRRRNEREQD